MSDDPLPLPPKWDGVLIEWGTWEPEMRMFICPPPKPEPCPECGLIRPKAFTQGKRVPGPRGLRDRGPLALLYRQALHAYRCTGCGHDQVYDVETDQLSDLDMTDYGPDGSWSVN